MRSLRSSFLTLLVAAAGLVDAAVAVAQPRIGDAGSVYDPSKDDPAYPEAKEWAKAGVEGGIPPRSATPVRVTVLPGQDIQAAIDAAEAPGVVLLAPGVHPIVSIELKSGIILRGADKPRTIIEIQEDGSDFIKMREVERAALEDLVVRHKLVDSIDPSAYYCKYDKTEGEIGMLTSLQPKGQNTIKLSKVKNVWIQNCDVIKNISRIIRIDAESSHVTLRDNVWDTALYKGGGGQAYYELVDDTSYVLMYNETLKDLRHLALDYGAHHNVLIYSKLEVDVNFHVGHPEHDNLVESLDSTAVPDCHFWGAFSHYLDPVGEGNLIYKAKPDYDDGKVYVVNWPGAANDQGEPFIQLLDRAPPTSGTLYPVTGVHRAPDPPGTEAPAGGTGSGGGASGGTGNMSVAGAPLAGAAGAGAAAGSGGAAPEVGGGAGNPSASSSRTEEGCSCRTAGGAGSCFSAVAALGLLVMARLRRRAS